MKKRLLIAIGSIVMLICMLAVTVSAETVIDSGNCGADGTNVTYTVVQDGDKVTLTLTGKKKLDDFEPGNSPFADYADKITDVVVDERITKVGEYFFHGFSSLKEIKLPDNCTVDVYAFSGCTSLETVYLSDNTSEIRAFAFADCAALKTVGVWDADTAVVENSCKIKANAFYGCVSLETVNLPSSVKTIEEHAFANCRSLKSIDLNNVTKLYEYAFKGCSSLTSVTLSTGLKEFGEYAFAGCTKLATVNFGDSIQVDAIPPHAFENCSSLTSVALPPEIMRIGEYAFSGCLSLTGITGIDNVTAIGQYAFRNCASLRTIAIPDGNTLVQNGVFLGCISLETVTIPESVLYIGQNAFEDCSALTAVELPVNLIGINKNAFAGCSSLTSIIIPKSVTYIKPYAFIDSGVKALIVLSPNTQIGDNAYGRFVSLEGEGIIGGSKVYGPAVSLAYYYSEENGLTFAAVEASGITVPSKYTASLNEAPGTALLAYKKGESDAKVNIAGNKVTADAFETVHMKLLKSGHKYISQPARDVNSAFEDYFGVELDRISDPADANPDKKHIYLSLQFIYENDEEDEFAYYGAPIDGTTCDVYVKEHFGIDDMGLEDFVIFEHNGDLYIHAGGHRGLTYAAAELREQYLGLRYFIGNDEDEATSFIDLGCIDIPSGLYDYQNSIIKDRDAQSEGYTGSSESDTVVAAYRKLSSWKNRGAFEKSEKYCGGVGYIGSAHSMVNLLNSYYGPAYWPTLSPKPYVQGATPCLSSDTYAEWLAACADVELSDMGSSRVSTEILRQAISISMEDSELWCECDDCLAMVEKENRSGAIINFVNKVADILVNEYGYDYTQVWTLSYLSGKTPPVSVVPRSNVTVCFTWQGCDNHPVTSDECTYTSYGTNGAENREWFEAWSEMTDQMYVWLYTANYTFYMSPSHEIFNNLENIRYFADRNVYGVYFEGQYGDDDYGDGYSLEPLNAYLQTKALWDPYMSEAEYLVHMKEFLNYKYGPGYEEILDTAVLDEEAHDDAGCYINNHDRPYDMYSLEYLDENFEDMIAHIDAARALAETDAQRAAIDTYSAHILFMGLSAAHERLYDNGSPEDKAEYSELYTRLHTIIKNNNISIGQAYNGNIPASSDGIDLTKGPAEAWINPTGGTGWRHNPLTYAEFIEAKDPTCTVDGNIGYWYYGEIDMCFADSKRQTKLEAEDTVVPATGHLTKVTINKKAPTCSQPGYTGDTLCLDCDEIVAYGDRISPLGHNFVDGKCTVCGATFIKPAVMFKDVKTSDWFYDDVAFAVERGLVNGMEETMFRPGEATTRAMLVTALWRLEGSPVVSHTMTFNDVKLGDWYAEAVRWASSNNIVFGMTPDTYAPNDAITREQMAAMLYRYSQYKKVDTSLKSDLKDFTDADKVSSYALDAVAWANANGIIIGKDNHILDPLGNATRDEMAALLHRYCDRFAK